MRAFSIGFAPRLAALYAALFATVGVQLPFFPVWLKARGMDAHTIGIVLAAPMVLRIVLTPAAARLADRTGALRGTIIALLAAPVLALSAAGIADDVLAVAVIVAMALASWNSAMPLTEAYAFTGLRHARAYGPVRLWGSAAFIAGSLLTGLAADHLPAGSLIWLIVAAVALSLLAAVALEPVHPASHPDTARQSASSLLHNAVFVTVIVGASLIQASHAAYYGFSTLAWTQRGLDGTSIAALWALGVAAEIVLFWLSGRLPPAVTPLALLVAGGALATVRWTAMAFDPPTALLPILQVLHAFSFGASHLGALGFIARAAAPDRRATAQSYYAIVNGAATAAMMVLAGWLYAAYGQGAYAAMALAAGAGCACGVVAHGAARRRMTA